MLCVVCCRVCRSLCCWLMVLYADVANRWVLLVVVVLELSVACCLLLLSVAKCYLLVAGCLMRVGSCLSYVCCN